VKRFWETAEAIAADDGFAIALDGRRVKTPAKADLILPTERLAVAVAAEWNGVGESIDPREMPLTGLANAAIDRIGNAKQDFAEGIARYGENDLTCYRAEGPDTLVAWQQEAWDALLDWARRRYDVDFVTCTGVMHVPQAADTVRKLSYEIAALDAFQLAGLSPMVTIGGSLVAALAVHEEMMPAEAVWEAVSLDDRWQLEQWGEDTEARSAMDARRRDFLAAARFLELLRR
jgi:chaperone required for assembly of F1-ATPase